MQGLIQIEMLKMIEQMTGKRISELFDWVVGTSTGGILALGMIYGEGEFFSLHELGERFLCALLRIAHYLSIRVVVHGAYFLGRVVIVRMYGHVLLLA